MGRIILLVTALLFVALGAAFLTIPVRLADIIDLGVGEPAALADVRAVYGGMQIGFGVFLTWCGLAIPRVRTGLLAALMVFAGLALGRFLGIVAEPSQPAITFVLLAVEILGVVLIGTGIVVGGERRKV